MGLYTRLPEGVEEVDVIVVGGGSAGCIVASRLADADPALSILVMESGVNNYNDPMIVHLGFLLSHIAPGNKYTTFYHGPKSEHLGGRQGLVPTGHVLGGGSSINMAIYSRGQRSDYDAWQTPGWTADEMLPYMNKLETYHGADPRERHGHSGPIQVTGGRFRSSRLEGDFINALGKVGWPELEDINNLDDVNGVMRARRYVGPDGRRQDTAHIYLHPRLQDGKHPNLHVLFVESQVERVIIEGGRATGVAYRPNPAFQSTAGSSEASSRIVKARKMVILCAGAFGTPLLLERSGVGSPQVLERAGVQLLADVPGVGHDYLDHQSMMYPYKSSLSPGETSDGINSGRLDPGELIANNDPILSWNAVDAQAKLRPTDADIASLGPEFQEAWDKEFKNAPDKPLMITSPFAAYPGDPGPVPPGQYFGIVAFNLHPFSRGHLHISGPGIDDVPDFEPGIASDPQGLDIKTHIWMYKKQREIARRMDVYRGELEGGHPSFPAHSGAVPTDSTAGPANVDRHIEYSADDDKVIEQWVRNNVISTWHPMGTCKMAPQEKMGVVDPALNVYGVQNLKIADLSITPGNLSANCNNTAMAIGEKAADIFIGEL
ncbi:hypothetical protein DL764_001931 [Monosporascus ibericus]|uniref:Glucose-methanol-choline oxidoreductase N-terminal domain-containing protein n=1 Tax=Monosporascus ibericus TaxID=155417 RepID=A0A4Q4TP49_9PEZI|nr:hypothetical protein DL764_001931 [Monosporascus ibericus]